MYGAPSLAAEIASRAPGEPVQHAHHADHLESVLAHPLDRLHGGPAGRDHVLHHEAALAGPKLRSLDPALEAVLLAILADEERLHGSATGQGGARHGVRSHGHAAHGGCPHALRLSRHQLTQRAESLRQQDRALRVHVVLRLLAAGERDLADHEGVLAQFGDQPVAGGVTHMCRFTLEKSGSAGGGR